MKLNLIKMMQERLQKMKTKPPHQKVARVRKKQRFTRFGFIRKGYVRRKLEDLPRVKGFGTCLPMPKSDALNQRTDWSKQRDRYFEKRRPKPTE